jgi:hypothetical protein
MGMCKRRGLCAAIRQTPPGTLDGFSMPCVLFSLCVYFMFQV